MEKGGTKRIDTLTTETRLYFFVLVSLSAICTSSCKENKRKSDAIKIVSEWTGKEITFPENVLCYISGKDTLLDFCYENFHKEYKILLYVDSVGCSSCRLQFAEWKQLIEEADRLFPKKVGFLLYFQPKNIKEICKLYENENYFFYYNHHLLELYI